MRLGNPDLFLLTYGILLLTLPFKYVDYVKAPFTSRLIARMLVEADRRRVSRRNLHRIKK
jgi:hypothetical protein